MVGRIDREKTDKDKVQWGAWMLFSNPRRIDYLLRYQEIINAYNSEQDRATIEKTFADLMNLANQMDEEQQRYVREGFTSDEELSLYDLSISAYRQKIYEYVYTRYKEVA